MSIIDAMFEDFLENPIDFALTVSPSWYPINAPRYVFEWTFKLGVIATFNILTGNNDKDDFVDLTKKMIDQSTEIMYDINIYHNVLLIDDLMKAHRKQDYLIINAWWGISNYISFDSREQLEYMYISFLKGADKMLKFMLYGASNISKGLPSNLSNEVFKAAFKELEKECSYFNSLSTANNTNTPNVNTSVTASN